MKQNKEIIFYSLLVFLGIIAIGLIIYTDNNTNNALSNSVNENTPNTEKLEENNEVIENEKTEENKESNITETEKLETSTTTNVTSQNKETNKQVNNSNSANTEKKDTNSTQELSTKDTTVITELNNIETSTDKLLTEGNDKSVLDKAKGVFITLVDFCFYDGEIKGVTFNELTEAGKEKVLKIVNSIDQKIENKFPGYKEKISTKTKSAFNKASELIKKGANNVKDFAQDKLGEENYNSIIEEKDELVKYTKNAWNIVKNVSSNLWSKTTSKLKDWYEKFREENE